MSSLKEIRRRIGSVKSTMQITRAMKLVSAAKLKRAQDLALNGRTFSNRLDAAATALVMDLRLKEFSHPVLEERSEVKVRRVIAIAGERGLCGAYNSNVLKTVESEQANQSCKVEYVAIGRRATAAAKRYGWHTVAELEGLSESPTDWPLEELAETCMTDFVSGAIDEVVLYYTKFVSGLSQEVVGELVLPLKIEPNGVGENKDSSGATTSALLYSPKPEILIEEVVPLLVATQIRQAAYEAKASEHASRMAAMDSATHNASELIDKLQLFYNRARQSAITRELIDVLGGAEAIS